MIFPLRSHITRLCNVLAAGICILAFSVGLAEFAYPQNPGQLDPGFGDSGRVVLDIGLIDHCEVMVSDADGNIYFGGSVLEVGAITRQEYLIGKLTPDGTLDTTFGHAGLLKGEFASGLLSRISDLKLSDEHLFFMGETSDPLRPDTQQVFIGKLDWDGNWINSFGTNGLFTNVFLSGSVKAGSFDVLPGEKLIWCGMTLDTLPWHYEIPLVVRLNPDGSLDSTFGGTGALTWSPAGGMVSLNQRTAAHSEGGKFEAILAEPDGYLLAGALYSGSSSEGLILRIDTTGAPDPAFGINGRLSINFAPTWSTVFKEIRKWGNDYLFGGTLLNYDSNEDFFLAASDALGAGLEMDGVDFSGLEDRAFDLNVDAYGKILLVGQSVDPSHGTLGSQSDQISFAALDDLEQLSPTFGQAGKFTWSPTSGADAGGTAICLTPNEQITIGGYLVDTSSSNFSDLVFLRLTNGLATSEPGPLHSQPIRVYSVYPNPSSDVLYVLGLDGRASGNIINSLGMVVMKQAPLQGGIDVSKLPAGIYYLEIDNTYVPFAKR